jgi:hypothetical protein
MISLRRSRRKHLSSRLSNNPSTPAPACPLSASKRAATPDPPASPKSDEMQDECAYKVLIVVFGGGGRQAGGGLTPGHQTPPPADSQTTHPPAARIQPCARAAPRCLYQVRQPPAPARSLRQFPTVTLTSKLEPGGLSSKRLLESLQPKYSVPDCGAFSMIV